MLITVKDNTPIGFLALALEDMIEHSRFTADVETKDGSKVINVRNVRLRERKPYCGNHPAACEAFAPRVHRRGNWLEGADWVEWNDRINDLLDAHECSAFVRTSVCIIRRGTLRRTSYEYTSNGFGRNTWIKEDPQSMEDCIGVRAPDSWFPQGTPGIYQRDNNYHCIG
jgi:hypothetical protein